MSSNKLSDLRNIASHFIVPPAQTHELSTITGIVPASPRDEGAALLTALPVELFMLIIHHLKAADIIRLSCTDQYVRHLLSTGTDSAASPLQCSLDILKHRNVYDETTGKLDLRLPPGPYTAAEVYETHLTDIWQMLDRNRSWAKYHVKILSLPLDVLSYWELQHILHNIALLLPGVTDMHLLPVSLLPSLHGGACANKLLINLAALEPVPVISLTIKERKGAMLGTTLAETLGKGAFPRTLQTLRITQGIENSSDRRHRSHGRHRSDKRHTSDEQIIFPDCSLYPALHTLDLSDFHSLRLDLQGIPATITDLRLRGASTRLSAMGVERLSIEGPFLASDLQEMLSGLPSLRSLYIAPPPQPDAQLDILKALAALLPTHLSLKLTTNNLHIEQMSLLAALQQNFTSLSLPEEITVEICTPAEIQHFTRLMKQGMFRHQKKITYQISSLPLSLSDFFCALLSGMQSSLLPSLQHFSLAYRNKWEAPFLERAEARIHLLQSKREYSLADILGERDYTDLPQKMISPILEGKPPSHVFPDMKEYQELEDTLQHALNEAFGAAYTNLMTHRYTAHMWLRHLERLYLSLYPVLIHQLLQLNKNKRLLDYYENRFDPSFEGTPVGMNILQHIQHLLFTDMAENIMQPFDAAFAAQGLIREASVVNAEKSHFHLHFTRQTDRSALAPSPL